MVQEYFIDSWLLPCSLRSHRIANPCPKMGFPFFGFAHPPPNKRAEQENFQMNNCRKNVSLHFVKQSVRYCKKNNK
jgi:hypothetical protein